MLNYKTHVIAHSDLDGCGCVILAKKATKVRSLKLCHYDTVDDEIVQLLAKAKKENWNRDEHLLLILDICPSRETCVELDKASRGLFTLHLVDHHVTKSWVAEYEWAYFSTASSATLLLLLFLEARAKLVYNNPVREWCRSIDAWDRWQLDSPHRKRGEDLNTLLHFIGFDEFIEKFSNSSDTDVDLTLEYQALLSYIKKNKERKIQKKIDDQLYKTKRYMDGHGNTFQIFFATEYISELAHAILDHPELIDVKYVVIVNPLTGTCSLRSRKDSVDVSALAKMLQGGGHKEAAGFTMNFTNRLETAVFNKLSRIDLPNPRDLL